MISAIRRAGRRHLHAADGIYYLGLAASAPADDFKDWHWIDDVLETHETQRLINYVVETSCQGGDSLGAENLTRSRVPGDPRRS